MLRPEGNTERSLCYNSLVLLFDYVPAIKDFTKKIVRFTILPIHNAENIQYAQ